MDDIPDWYAVSTWAAHALDARAELAGLGIVTYVPCETVDRRVGRKAPTPIKRPVWPGYVFLRCYPGDFGAVLAIEGIHDFVRDFDQREPVKLQPNDLVPVLMAELFGDLDYTRKPAAWTPSRGDSVKVRSGKWKGYLGRVMSVAKRKVVIETKWCKMELPPEDLEAAA